MKHNINIESERYTGKFAADLKSEKCWTGDEDNYEYTGYFYEGTGIIKDKKADDEYVFQFKTGNYGSPFSYETKTLEEMILKNKNPDLALKYLVSKLMLSEEEIPFIEIK